MKRQKPTLCIVAGPNGSGKTTTTVQLLQNEWTSDSIYINPDNIAQESFGNWNSPDAVLKAAQKATEQRYRCLAKKENFVFETVFSSDEKVDFIRKAKENGFFIRFFFVCTENPTINVLRVTKRYLCGGHEVPISKICSRYYKSIINAATILPIVDRAYLYDNSIENETPKLICRFVDGTIFKKYVETYPEWVKGML